MSALARWTFMVYMAGDNNLSDAGDRDLAELRQVGSTPDVNIVVEFDSAGANGTRRIRIERNGADEAVVELAETDSGSPQTLSDFIAWAADEYPAEHYALILWNHGGGWQPTEMDEVARSVGTSSYNPRESVDRSESTLGRVFFRSSLEAIFSLPEASDRAICSDDGSGHSLDMVELGRVLEAATARLGKPLDLVGMDACLMSNLEVAYQVQPYARYLVASEEVEPNQGWPYDAVLGALTARPEMTGAELADQIVAAYLAFYDQLGKTPVTQAALDLAQVGELATQLDALADALVAAMPGAGRTIWDAQRGSARFYSNTLWDIAHFCEALGSLTTDATITAAANAVRSALTPGEGRFVRSAGARGDAVAKAGGVSIYLLPNMLDLSRYYADVRFAADHRWRGMLEAYHAS